MSFDTLKAIETLGIELEILKITEEKLFDNPFTGMILVTPEGKIIGANSKMCSVLGYEEDELKNSCVDSLVHSDCVEDLYANCRHMPGQRRNRSGIFIKLRKKDGQYIETILNIVNHNNDEGKIIGHVLYFDKYTGEKIAKSYIDGNGEKKWVAIEDKDQKEEFLCNIFHGIQDAILILDVRGNVVSYNTRLIDLLEISLDQAIEIGNLSSISPSEINMKVADRYLKEAFDGHDQLFTWQFIKPNCGTVIDVEIFISKISKMGDEVLLVTVRDITDKKKIEDNLKDSENRYRQLVELSPDGIVIHKKGIIKYVNPAAAAILGGDKEEDILGLPVVNFFPEDRREAAYERLKDLYEKNISMPLMESDMVRIDGEVIHIEFAAMPFEMEGKTAVQVVIRDVTEKKKQDAYIHYLAMHDKLTGLPNRELLADRISKAAKRRSRDNLKNAVIYLDLDGFKPINDTLGHDAGDQALKEIAVRLEDSVRGSDTAARIGGDEFVVLLEGVDSKDEIEIIANRILTKINEPLDINGYSFHVGASMGVSIYPDDSEDHGELMKMADRAMYYVKVRGKNHFEYYSVMP